MIIFMGSFFVEIKSEGEFCKKLSEFLFGQCKGRDYD
jgi:hypothetical protein